MDDSSEPPGPDRRELAPPPTEDLPVLGRHSLSHLPHLKVDRSIFETRYAPRCSPANCEGTCCRMGVHVDVAQRDQILAHAALVQAAMAPEQERDPALWFEDTENVDPDFPSGRCAGTRVHDDRCVFLDAAGRCALHRATIAAARPGLDLKPFFCTAFPITISAATLWVDELCEEGLAQCCRPAADGALDVTEVCESELRHVLGSEGLVELRLLAREARP